MILTKGNSKFKLLLFILIGSVYCMLGACNTNNVNNQISNRKFLLTKDSTFIGTWYGRVYIEKINLRDSIYATYSLYSKDSTLYMYQDYGYLLSGSDSAILDNIIVTGICEKFTDSLTASHNFLSGKTISLDKFYINDSVIFTYRNYNPTNTPVKLEDISFNDGIGEYYKINADNSLSLISENHLDSKINSYNIRYTLQPYIYNKQD